MPEPPINPIFLAPIATSAAIAVTLVLWIMNVRRRELSYEVLSDTPLLSEHDGLKEQLEIRFRGEPVHDVRLMMVKIVNSGNVSIRSSDFEGRLKISVPKGSRILMADVDHTFPSNLHERGTSQSPNGPLIEGVNENEVTLRPVLFNGKDYIVTRVLVSKPEGTISVTGHIEGISELKQAKETSMMPIVLANLGAFIMAVSLFFLDPHSLYTNDIAAFLPYLVFFLVGYVMLLSGIYYPKLTKRALSKALGS